MHEKVKTPEVEEKSRYWKQNKTHILDFIKLPYIGDMSHQIEKEIRQDLFKKTLPKIKICYGYTKQQLLAKNSGTRTVKHCYTAQK